MGQLVRARGGRLSFRYHEGYLGSGYGVPLSLAIPLDDRDYGHEKISPWLWGLLPDNELILARWGQRFHVSPGNCYSLLKGVGEDCAGAVRFIRPEDAEEFADGGKEALSESDVEQRLADLKKDPALGREPADRGQFSLAGAQSKTALQQHGQQWYVPWGSEPTTHILKPPRSDLDGHVENEHFCLRLAAALGLSVARSKVMYFGEEAAIVVERYDRVSANGQLTRVHQEDVCQALGVHPSRKYQNEGGPDIVQLMALMDRSSQSIEDRRRVMEAIIFNYLILGTDAHAKNYSLLLGRQQQVRLARLYDIASFLPYVDRRKDCRFAMKIGSYYRDAQIQPRHFEKMARSCGFPVASVFRMLIEMASQIPEYAGQVHRELRDQGIEHPVLDRLVELLETRSLQAQRTFEVR